ncbi:MAG: hypothetical protein M3015_08395 [Bacteroidota bacterium]|nr:hypothetical protein [Bacteroidota bacterium]
MDSLLQNDELMKMISHLGEDQSYFRINIGIGNRLFTEKNKAVENLQTNGQLVFTPSVGYFHKSGLSLSFTGFLLSENNKTDFYQYALSPSYSYSKGKWVDVILSYSHYFKKTNYSSSASPFDDEFYGSGILKKYWIKPSVSIGYSSGRYNEIVNVDTIVMIANRPAQIKFIDTATTTISSFSVAAGIEHDFNFFNLLSKKDGLRLTPQLSIITGINDYSVSNKRSVQLYNTYVKRKLKHLKHFQPTTAKSNYEVQSVGFDLDLNYTIGKFYLEPEVYLDYFLPATNDKRFTQIFNFNIGITF